MDEPQNTGKGTSQLEHIVSCFCDVFLDIKDSMEHDSSYWRIAEIVDKPQGQRQPCVSNLFDHEYVLQDGGGPTGDLYSGYVFFPVNGKYLKVEYSS